MGVVDVEATMVQVSWIGMFKFLSSHVLVLQIDLLWLMIHLLLPMLPWWKKKAPSCKRWGRKCSTVCESVVGRLAIEPFFLLELTTPTPVTCCCPTLAICSPTSTPSPTASQAAATVAATFKASFFSLLIDISIYPFPPFFEV